MYLFIYAVIKESMPVIFLLDACFILFSLHYYNLQDLQDWFW